MLNDMHLLAHDSSCTFDLAGIRHLRMSHILDRRRRRLAHTSRLLPTPSALRSFFPVRRKVKADKEQQVAAQDPHPRKCCEFFASAFPNVGHPGKIGAREIAVGGEVDKAEIDDELQDLQAGDVLFPPDLDAAGRLEVIPVHHDVDEEVEGYRDPGDGGKSNQLRVAKEGRGAVVVGVEEGERFFLEDHEDRVEELEVFREVIKLSLHVSGAFLVKKGP